MILDPNGMPILQPTVDNAETATFNDAFAAIGNTRQIKTYKWADNAARTAQTGMTAGDEGYQTDTDTTYIYSGSVWRAVLEDTGWVAMSLNSGWTVSGTAAAIRRINGVVYTRGRVDRASTADANIFTIPVGFRVEELFNFWIEGNTSLTRMYFPVDNSGFGPVATTLGNNFHLAAVPTYPVG